MILLIWQLLTVWRGFWCTFIKSDSVSLRTETTIEISITKSDRETAKATKGLTLNIWARIWLERRAMMAANVDAEAEVEVVLLVVVLYLTTTSSCS